MYLLRYSVLIVGLIFITIFLSQDYGTVHGKFEGFGTTTRVSIASVGTEGNGMSSASAISGDGRYVAFQSLADTLVVGDTNEAVDIFVHDRHTSETFRVSVASDGTQANNGSFGPDISLDGRYVAFRSEATNLVGGDTNASIDVFVHDRQTGQTRRVSIASDGTQANSSAFLGALSADGRFITFHSGADNLVMGDTNGVIDVFVHDRQTSQTRRISVSSNGSESDDHSFSGFITSNGRYSVFSSYAGNLVTGDTNGVLDGFVYDLQANTTTRISVASDGTQGNGISFGEAISADARFVLFASDASNLVSDDTNGTRDVFIFDRQTAETQRISVSSTGVQANGGSYLPSFSADGRYVTYSSDASNLVVEDSNARSDIFVYDRTAAQTRRVSVASDDTEANDNSYIPVLSSNGRYIAFESLASNLVPNDTNTLRDIFIRDQGVSKNPVVYIPIVLRQLAPVPTCEVLDHEPNNVFLDADNNQPLCSQTVVSGTVSPANDVNDIYRIVVPEPGRLQIDLGAIPAGADYDLYLYDARGGNGQLAVSNTSGSSAEAINLAVSPGRYYIRVVSLQYAGTNTYELQWKVE